MEETPPAGRLVVTRRINETVIISTSDGEIVVELLGIVGKRTRLGFRAPPKVAINRSENRLPKKE